MDINDEIESINQNLDCKQISAPRNEPSVVLDIGSEIVRVSSAMRMQVRHMFVTCRYCTYVLTRYSTCS